MEVKTRRHGEPCLSHLSQTPFHSMWTSNSRPQACRLVQQMSIPQSSFQNTLADARKKEEMLLKGRWMKLAGTHLAVCSSAFRRNGRMPTVCLPTGGRDGTWRWRRPSEPASPRTRSRQGSIPDSPFDSHIYFQIRRKSKIQFLLIIFLFTQCRAIFVLHHFGHGDE